jgi:MinD superfamily P-loop ATPase
VASGKGGTGKTIIATSLALCLENGIFIDADVEEPNAYIFLKPEIKEVKPVFLNVPLFNAKKCTYCGKCADFCQFKALAVIPKQVIFFAGLCHGCGGCRLVCDKGAIEEEKRHIGEVQTGQINQLLDLDVLPPDTPFARHKDFFTGPRLIFRQGKLSLGEALAVPVVRAVKEDLTPKNSHPVVIIDAPPGTSCPVVEAINGSDYCLLVTEPTPFGLSDLKLAREIVKELKIPAGVVVNRVMAEDGLAEIKMYCQEENIPILATFPFDRQIAYAYSKGIPLIYAYPEGKEKMQNILKQIKKESTLRQNFLTTDV